MNKYFNIEDKIGKIIGDYPETLDVFVTNGFEQLSNPIMRKTMANSVSLEMALKMKKISVELFCNKLEDAISQNRNSVDKTLSEEGSFADGDIRIEGVLPCPIRLPLLENFSAEVEKLQSTMEKKIGFDLRSASMGIEFIQEQVATGDVNKLPDMMLSAGFELFFDKKYMGQYNDKGIFKTNNKEFNSDFCNDAIDLRDPKGEYYIIGVVPAVLMVNETFLGDRECPKTWADILKPEFENSLALPMKDLDLFNAVILHIYAEFGEDGIKNLARSFYKSLHPAQMVKLKPQERGPAINISPYFFTQMIPAGGNMKAVWPEDGAIISPIFLVAKKDREELLPFMKYFTSKEVGEIFSSNGKFPSTNPLVDNKLSDDKTFKWVGWDYIHNNDIGDILNKCENLFNDIVLG